MPPIRGMVLGLNPVTGVDGFWIEPTWLEPGTWIGSARTEWPTPPSGGSQSNRIAAFKSGLEVALNKLGEVSRIIDDPEELAALQAKGNPRARFVGNTFFYQQLTFLVTVLSVSPITIGDVVMVVNAEAA